MIMQFSLVSMLGMGLIAVAVIVVVLLLVARR